MHQELEDMSKRKRLELRRKILSSHALAALTTPVFALFMCNVKTDCDVLLPQGAWHVQEHGR
jgi:hypothetical protein